MLDHQHHQQPFHHCRRSSFTCNTTLTMAMATLLGTPNVSRSGRTCCYPDSNGVTYPSSNNPSESFRSSQTQRWSPSFGVRNDITDGKTQFMEMFADTTLKKHTGNLCPAWKKCKTTHEIKVQDFPEVNGICRVQGGSWVNWSTAGKAGGLRKGRKIICQTIHFGLHFWDVKGLAALPMALQSICVRIWLVRVVRERKILTLGWEKVRYLHWH